MDRRSTRALQNIVEDREVMALVYLCDDLTIRAEAAEDSTKVVTVPSGQMVEIWDVTMDEDYQVWEKVSAEVKGKVYEGYIPGIIWHARMNVFWNGKNCTA